MACLLVFGILLNGHAQGTFINLNFESAKIILDSSSPYYPYAANASAALPGWTVVGLISPNDIFYNDVSLGATSVSLQGTNGIFPSLDGAFSVNLYGGVPSSPTGASISQTAIVPLNTVSLCFIAQGVGSAGGPLLVSLGGQNIPFSAISTGPNYTTYGGDVSAFAGQVEQLTFAAPQGVNNYWTIDDIQFSTSPVPEPGTCALILCGAAAFGMNRWRKRCKRVQSLRSNISL